MTAFLVGFGVALIGLGAYLATTERLKLWGYVATAVGTYAMYHGSRREAKSDAKRADDKMSEIQRQIAAARQSASSPQEADKLDSIGHEFRAWAADFVRNKEHHQLAVQREQIGQVESQLHRSEVWRPVLETVIDTIRKSVQAYAVETGKPISSNFPSLPTNLFDKSKPYKARVDFGSGIQWTIELDREAAKGLLEVPVLWLFLDQRGKDAERVAHIWSYGEGRPVHVAFHSETITKLSGIEGQFAMQDVDGLRRSIQRLVESQLLYLQS